MLTKLTLAITAVLVLAGVGSSQEPCSKSINESPAFFGLKLDMSFEELQAALGPAIKIKPSKTGEGSFFQNFIEQAAPSNFAGVRAMFVRFSNNKVYQIEIFYEDKDQSTKLEDFINSLSVEKNLPAASWKIKNGRAEMNCGDFVLTADTILNRHIELTDDAGFKDFQTKKQQKKKPSKKKKNSSP